MAFYFPGFIGIPLRFQGFAHQWKPIAPAPWELRPLDPATPAAWESHAMESRAVNGAAVNLSLGSPGSDGWSISLVTIDRGMAAVKRFFCKTE
jgi:hypothetical protein